MTSNCPKTSQQIRKLAEMLEALAIFTTNEDRASAFRWVAELLKKILEDDSAGKDQEKAEPAIKGSDAANSQ